MARAPLEPRAEGGIDAHQREAAEPGSDEDEVKHRVLRDCTEETMAMGE